METYRNFFRLTIHGRKTDECVLDRIPKAYHNLYMLMAEEVMQTFPEEEWSRMQIFGWSPHGGLIVNNTIQLNRIMSRYEFILPHICPVCGKPKIRSLDSVYGGSYGVCPDCIDKLHPDITTTYSADLFNTPARTSRQEWDEDFSKLNEVDISYIYDMLETMWNGK